MAEFRKVGEENQCHSSDDTEEQGGWSERKLKGDKSTL